MTNHESSSNNTDNARTDANRRNAQLSTGPRTEEGKARSAQNARRSGWFARDLRVTEGQEELYLEFEHAWFLELDPANIAELECFHDFVRAAWHKREVVAAQNEATPSGSAAFLDDTLARKLDRLHRYERDFERRAARHLRDLRRLQAERHRVAPTKATATTETASSPEQTQSAASPQPDIPDSLRREIHLMIVQSAYWNAKVRAVRAGVPLDPPSIPDQPPTAAA